MLKSAWLHIAGTVAYAISQWLIIFFATRFVSLEVAGLYAYYLALFTPAYILGSFGLRNSISSDTESRFLDHDYKKARIFGMLLFLGFSVACLTIVRDDLFVGVLVFSVKFIELYSELIYGNWIRNKNAQRYGVSRLLKLITFLLVFLLAYIILGSDQKVLYAYPISILIITVAYDMRFAQLAKLRAPGSFLSTRHLVRVSIPLAVGAFLISLNSSMPRIVIKEILGEEMLGLYVLAVYFISIAVIPVTSYSQILIPVFARMSNVQLIIRSKQFARLIGLVCVYWAAFVGVLVLLGDLFLSHVYALNQPYERHSLLLVGIAGGFQFIMTVGNGLLVAVRQFNVVMKASVVGMIAMFAFSYVLTKEYNLSGSFLALCLGNFVLMSGVWLGIGVARSVDSVSFTK